MINMKIFLRVVTLGLVLLGMNASLTACNTVEGVGKDIKSAGDKLDESASRHNTYKARSH